LSNYPDHLMQKRVHPRASIRGKHYHRLINGICNDVNKGYAPVVVISGQMGKGKSMAALELARILHNEIHLMQEELTPDNIQDHLFYNVVPFLKFVYNNKRKVAIIDEAGVNLNSKDFHDKFNRKVDKTIQTMRKNNNVYIFVTPRIMDLDKSIRNFIDYKIEAIGKGVLKPTKIKAKHAKLNSRGSNVNSYPIYKPYWKPDLPPNDLVKAYRDKEEDWKDDSLLEDIEELEEEERQKELEKKTGSLDDIL